LIKTKNILNTPTTTIGPETIEHISDLLELQEALEKDPLSKYWGLTQIGISEGDTDYLLEFDKDGDFIQVRVLNEATDDYRLPTVLELEKLNQKIALLEQQS
jgi:hypothetical protein